MASRSFPPSPRTNQRICRGNRETMETAGIEPAQDSPRVGGAQQVESPANRGGTADTARPTAQEGWTPMQDVPYGYCHCGCGQKTKIARISSTRDGYIKGEPRLWLPGHASRVVTKPLPGDPEFDSRFWTKVDKGALNDCWVWTGYLSPAGYAMVKAGDVRRAAHRVAYELLVGPIPEGLTLDHLCENPPCVNPAHLEPVTAGVNNLRGNSPWALNAKKTHCKRGHPLSGDNLMIGTGGRRRCRTCARLRSRAAYARKKAEAAHETAHAGLNGGS